MVFELEDVADGGAPEAVEALVVVADYAEVGEIPRFARLGGGGGEAGEEAEDFLLDGVGVLVFVHHKVADFGAQGSQHVGVVLQELERFVLDGGEIQGISFGQLRLVELVCRAERAHFRLRGGGQHGRVERLFADQVQPGEQRLALIPRTGALTEQQFNIRNGAIVPDVLVKEVVLVELLHHREVVLEAGIFTILLKPAQADRVERADGHLVEVQADVQRVETVGYPREQLAGRLLGERRDEERLRRHAALRHQICRAFDQRKRLARPWPGDDEQRAFGGGDRRELGGIGGGLEYRHQDAPGNNSPPASVSEPFDARGRNMCYTNSTLATLTPMVERPGCCFIAGRFIYFAYIPSIEQLSQTDKQKSRVREHPNAALMTRVISRERLPCGDVKRPITLR